MILLNCEHATDRMTDHMEGALPWPKRLMLLAHLAICRACREFLRSLKKLPAVTRTLLAKDPPETSLGGQCLETALKRIQSGEGRGPTLHPEASQWQALDAGDLDLAQRLLLETHLGACAACRRAHPEATAHPPATAGAPGDLPMPTGVQAALPPAHTWTWYRHFLKGARSARLWEDAATGAGLWLTFVPRGKAFPAHAHRGEEAAVLLSGWVRDGLEVAGPGDFVHRIEGTQHAPVATGPNGCWILARVGSGGVHFSGWRSLFG